eukprot:scaffold340763_cov189-Cyclotella_meneghiniana.AAC.3
MKNGPPQWYYNMEQNCSRPQQEHVESVAKDYINSSFHETYAVLASISTALIARSSVRDNY